MRRERSGYTQASAAEAAMPVSVARFDLLALPEDILEFIGRLVLAADLPAGLRLRQSCGALHGRLELIKAEAEARRLRWVEAVRHGISADGQVLTSGHDSSSGLMSWAVGPLLPVQGKSSWSVKVEVSHNNNGSMFIGVCDAAGCNAWGMCLKNGLLYREHRDARRRVYPRPPPPNGWPNGNCLRVMKDESGKLIGLYGKAVGAVIQVLFDHDEGVLSYRVEDGPLLEALKGFPTGAAHRVRPWARLPHWCPQVHAHVCDRIRFVRPYL